MTDSTESSTHVVTRRDRLYAAYATTHAGRKNLDQEELLFRSEILPRIPALGQPAEMSIIDIGCGQGNLVKQLVDHGYVSARGIDVSPEQARIAHTNGVPSVICGDYAELLERESGMVNVVIATDFIEHFTKDEVLTIFERVRHGLQPGGAFIVRTPNATSPFFGNYQYGDFTHESVFTPSSFSQIAANTGFAASKTYSASPVGNGLKGIARRAVWSLVSTTLRVALAAETGGKGHIVTQNFIGVAKA